MLYATDPPNNRVLIVDASSNAVVGQLQTNGQSLELAFHPAGHRLYLSANAGDLLVYSIDSNYVSQLITTLSGVGAATAVGVDPTGSNLYVVDRGGQRLVIIDTASNTINTIVPLGGFGYGLAFSPNMDRAYVTTSSPSRIIVIDTQTKAIVQTISAGTDARGIAIQNNRAYVANGSGSNTVTVVDLSTGQTVTSIPVGEQPFDVRASIDGKKIYAAAFGFALNGGSTISVIESSSNTVTATIPTGNLPYRIAAGLVPIQ